jgi:hypothetical protein
MKHPQTLAEELYKRFPTQKLKSIKENACCAFALIWWLGLDLSDIDAIMLISDLIKEKALDVDCTVYWGECIRKITGRDLESLEKKNITSIKNIKEKTIVKFSRGKVGHWVGVENGKVVFNSLKSSLCVSEGKPTECRIIKIKGIK